MSAREPQPPARQEDPEPTREASARELGLQARIAQLEQEVARLTARPTPPHGEQEGPLKAVSRYLRRQPPGGSDDALVEYQALSEALSQVFPIGVFRLQADGTLSHVDQSLSTMFGLTPDEFVDYGWFRRIHPDDLPEVKEYWDRAISDGEALSLEFRIRLPDGEKNEKKKCSRF